MVKKTTAKKSKAIAKKDSSTMVVSDAFLDDAENFATKVDKDDVLIPRIAIAQTLSKVVSKKEADFIKDCEVGDFYDKSQDNFYSGEKGIIILPVHYRKTNIEWETRKKGGKFVADRGLDVDFVNSCKRNEETNKLMTPDGNILSPTCEYAVFVLDGEGSFFPAMVSMSGMQVKKSKKLMTMVSNFLVDSPRGKVNPAMFYRSYKFTTVPESNDQGDWFGYAIEIGACVPDIENGQEIYLAAREFRKQMDAGTVKAQQYEGEAESDEDDDAPM